MTQDELKELLSYDPETGAFAWLKDMSQRVRAGDAAGHRSKEGYVIIRIAQKHFKAHRLAWLYVHGEWPHPFIDHINRDPGDNRICNLREATRSENNFNRDYPNPNGLKGVTIRRTSSGRARYIAQISMKDSRTGDVCQRYLGRFDTAEEASEVYQLAEAMTREEVIHG